MHSSREDIEFLARSRSRVEVLYVLDDGSRTRDELGEAVDSSRVTIDRALDDLGDRGWIVHSDGRYEPTPRGAFIASELRRLLPTDRGERDERASGGVDGATRETATDIPLETIGFLARSQHRIEVLDGIRAEPRTRDELQTLTDASPTTFSRILAELEDRDWIDRTNHRCRPTPRGADIAAAFIRLLSNLEAAETLDEVLGWLPTDEFAFELACLDDAEIILADYWEDPTRSIQHVAELVRSADHARIVGPGAARAVAESIREMIEKRDGTFEGVMEARGVETIRDDEVLREQFRDILTSDRATIAYHHEDRPLLVVAIADDTVVLCGSEDRDIAHDTVESDHEQVHAWATSYFEAAKANAQPLDVDAITP